MATDRLDGDENKQETEVPKNEGKASPKADSKVSGVAEKSSQKPSCKKHSENTGKTKVATKSKKKKKRRTRKLSSSENESSSSTSSLSSCDTSDNNGVTNSNSDSSDAEEEKRKRKVKKAKAKTKKAKEQKSKKARIQKRNVAVEGDSSDSDDESLPDEKLAKMKNKALRAAQKQARDEQEADEIDIEEDPKMAKLRAMQAQLARLGLSSAGARTASSKKTRAGLSAWTDRDLGLDDGTNRVKVNKGGKAKKQKRASKVAFKRIDQLWDQSIHNYKLTETIEDHDADEWDQYIFTVRRKFDWEHKYQETLVDVRSKPLREALKHIMKDVKGVSLVQETPHVDPNMLFLYLEESRNYLEELKALSKSEQKKEARRSAATRAKHLRILIKYLDKDFAEIKRTLYPLLENNMITFELLWALFKPNTIACCPTYGDQDQPRAFKIEYAVKESNFMKGSWYSIEGRYLEYDGRSFGMGTMHEDVQTFTGSRKISSLNCYPLQYHKDVDKLRNTLIERGKKFVALKGMNYRMHKGMAYTKRKRQVLKININGRVMVDPAIHRRINPNYPVSTVRPKEEPDTFENSEQESGDDESCRCGDQSSSDEDGLDDNTPPSSEDLKQRKRYRVVKDEKGQHHLVEIEEDENGEEVIQKAKLAALGGDSGDAFSDEELLIASPVVLGFAFSEKLWLEFTVSGISDVVWNDGAFDSLVLPANQKAVVKALVSSHAFHPSRNIDDIIAGKGKGLVAVLHGSPGTGKTLTAEGIADLLKCPLYMVSAGDLGTDPRSLEKELQNILDIAHSWGALLLLDEADVFLEKRSIHDIHRNALVSIFLRLLEYFQGILFLTTNRVETFDEAFVSRIHLSLKYEGLSPEARKRVWKTFIDRVKAVEGIAVSPLTDSNYESLARKNLNGRQIKNLTRAAQALAVDEGRPLSMDHIKCVVDLAETFEINVTGGNPDAMRSVYT